MEKQYMVIFHLPNELDQNFLTTIPEQRMKVDKLMLKGTIINYALSLDRTKLWVTFNAKSEMDLIHYINLLPLSQRMEWDYEELMFHHGSYPMPAVSLN